MTLAFRTVFATLSVYQAYPCSLSHSISVYTVHVYNHIIL
jgi:hypothetical protein